METDRRIGPQWGKPAVSALAVVAVGAGAAGVALDVHALLVGVEAMWRRDEPDLAGIAVRSRRLAHAPVRLTANVEAGAWP
jgi:hypothetical protein